MLHDPKRDDSARVLDLRPKDVWATLRRQTPAFWFLCLYVMVEYVRPQQVWTAIDVLPWGQFTVAATLVATLFEPPSRRKWFFLDTWLTLFTVILILSVAGAFSFSYSVARLEVFINWLLLFYLTTRIVRTERALLLYFLAFVLWSLKMSQHGTRTFLSRGLAFASWGATGAPGWFHNSGEFAIQMCVFLPMALHFILAFRNRWPKWKTFGLLILLPGTAFISLLASSSRGGQVAGAAVLVFMVIQSRNRWRGLVAIAVLLPALWFIMPAEQKTRFDSMGDDNTSVARLTLWRHGLEIMRDYPILGVGYESWLPYYRQHYRTDGQVSHNIFIQAGAELGYTGLLAFVALIVATFLANARTRRRTVGDGEWGAFLRSMAFGLDAALVGYLVAGFFVTVLYYPFFWMNLTLTATLYLITERRYRERQRTNPGASRAAAGEGRGSGLLLSPSPLAVNRMGASPRHRGR